MTRIITIELIDEHDFDSRPDGDESLPFKAKSHVLKNMKKAS